VPKPRIKSKPLRKTIVIEKWVSGWLYCLQHNVDYKAYCDAKTTQDDTLCKELEGKFPKIAELYDDWGQIHGMDPSSLSADFNPWYGPRRHLFSNQSEVKWIPEPSSYTVQEGHLLLDVPLDAIKAETMDKLKRFIDDAYLNRTGRAEESTDLTERQAYQPLPGPKYPLYGELMKSSIGKLLKTIYVNDLVIAWPSTEPLTNANIVRRAIKDTNNPFGWKMLQKEHDAIANGTFHKLPIDRNDLTAVKRHLVDFRSLVRNTIHGRFPDYR
jgi:hypothetical protein